MIQKALETDPELARGGVEPSRQAGRSADDPRRRATRGPPPTSSTSTSTSTSSRRTIWSRRTILWGVVALGAIAVIAAVSIGLGGALSGSDSTFTYYTVEIGDLPITVVERGAIESQQRVQIFCEVDDVEGDSIRGTPILSLVSNGSSVTEGQLIVELDVSAHRERLDRQILDTDRARSEQIQARVKFDNQKTQNETTRAEAELKVELAELALQQFEDETGGTFQIDLQDVELQIQEAQAGKLIEETNLEGVEQLYKLGYRSSGELAQARLSALKTERQLAASIARRKELVAYQYRKTRLELEGALASAKRALVQVERDNEALLAQSEALMRNADEALKKEEERLARYQTQVENAKIFAPKTGMIAYASTNGRFWEEEIREGSAVRPRQVLMEIPDLEHMQVRTFVHESVLDQVRPGLPATIRIEALPGQTYRATLRSVAVLADQARFATTGAKVYETVVTIDEKVGQLKPGMSAVVEIHVARLTGVLSVPVQAIVQRRHETWCYVGASGAVERRAVVLGRTNEKFVEVQSGVVAGESIVLNPTAVLEDQDSKRATREISPTDGAGGDDWPERDESPVVGETAEGAGSGRTSDGGGENGPGLRGAEGVPGAGSNPPGGRLSGAGPGGVGGGPGSRGPGGPGGSGFRRGDGGGRGERSRGGGSSRGSSGGGGTSSGGTSSGGGRPSGEGGRSGGARSGGGRPN